MPADKPTKITDPEELARVVAQAAAQEAITLTERRIVEWLRAAPGKGPFYAAIADAIERGEHRG